MLITDNITESVATGLVGGVELAESTLGHCYLGEDCALLEGRVEHHLLVLDQVVQVGEHRCYLEMGVY